jgi:hypothetical protein
MNRTLNVVRLQLVNKQTYIWVPLLVLFGALALTLAVYALIRSGGASGPMYGGGAQAPLWYSSSSACRPSPCPFRSRRR